MIAQLSKLKPQILVDSVVAYAESKVHKDMVLSDRMPRVANIISDTHIKIMKHRRTL